MRHIVPEMWNKLEQARPTGDRLVARLASEISDRVLCALDSGGRRHLLIALQADQEGFHDRQSRGLEVSTLELVIRGQSAARYIDIECNVAEGHAALDILGGEMAEELGRSTRDPAEIIKRALSRWRRFWGEIPKRILSREEQLGLFAELWFLSSWLLPKLGPDAIVAWRGPFGERHDFVWPGSAVEVKATTNSRGRIHQIHGLDQLDSLPGGSLLLFSLRLREETEAPSHLPSIIERCRNELSADSDAMGRFETILARAGYSPAYDEEYSNLRLRVIEEALFSVTDNFPRLSQANFAGGMPGGIERVQYEINLNTFDHLILAKRADDWVIM